MATGTTRARSAPTTTGIVFDAVPPAMAAATEDTRAANTRIAATRRVRGRAFDALRMNSNVPPSTAMASTCPHPLSPASAASTIVATTNRRAAPKRSVWALRRVFRSRRSARRIGIRCGRSMSQRFRPGALLAVAHGMSVPGVEGPPRGHQDASNPPPPGQRATSSGGRARPPARLSCGDPRPFPTCAGRPPMSEDRAPRPELRHPDGVNRRSRSMPARPLGPGPVHELGIQKRAITSHG